MTTFFFTTCYGTTQTETPVDLPDVDAAWREAAVATGEWFKEISSEFQPGQHWELAVTDAQNKPMYLFRVAAEKKI